MGVIEKVPAYIERIPGGGIVTTSMDWVLNESRASSMWYMLFGLACCAIEMMATGASRYDFDRFGMIFRASPRQADLMFVAGTVTHKMSKRVKVLYEQMAEPRYVIAMGGCACNGGPFYYDCYSVLKRYRQGYSGRCLYPRLPAPSRIPDGRVYEASGKNQEGETVGLGVG